MNSADDCHTIEGCPGLYVDAFKGHFLKKTVCKENIFILSHYHADHYQQLPREHKYRGPAQIHCTTITANLLRQVHQVPSELVVAHDYGVPFPYNNNNNNNTVVTITFYDAHHCPGAAIILFEERNDDDDDGKVVVHIHTGDMRYNEKLFATYPRLSAAINNNNSIDTVYLDTTYSHPKHDFVPQKEAIQDIASQVEQELCSDNNNDNTTLILLSCYSII